MPATIGDLSVYLGPDQLGGPDPLLEVIIDFIDSAQPKQKLMVAVQEIDNKTIVEALIRAKQRKVTIDVVIEQDHLLGRLSKKVVADPFAPIGKNQKNRELADAMLRCGIDVKSDFNSSIFHQKFMILGDSVLTGSTNFTTTGVNKNLNHIVVINDATTAKAYKSEFREMQQGLFGKLSAARQEHPTLSNVSAVAIKTMFAPDHAPELEIVKCILKAKQRIDFAIFTFANSSTIDEALIAACERGVQVSGIMDNAQSKHKWAATDRLLAAGVQLKLAGGSDGVGKLHHKLMVIDDKVTITGSFNYTGPANKSNDENIVVIGKLDESHAQAIANQQHIAQACRHEIDRIGNEYGQAITA